VESSNKLNNPTKFKLAILILCAIQIVRADPITVTVTLTDADQAALAQRQSRETDANVVALSISDYALSLFDRSRTNITVTESVLSQKAAKDVIGAAFLSADSATQDSVQKALGVTVPAATFTAATGSPSPTPVTVKPPQSP